MGSVCQKHNKDADELIIEEKKPFKKEKGCKDTITIPNGSGTAVSQKKQEEEEISPRGHEEVKQDIAKHSEGNELKRGDKKKLGKIAAVGDKEEVFENITKKEKVKSPFDYQLILNAFSAHSIFKQIQASDKEVLVEKMFYCSINDGEFVFKQGDRASSYFLIERGQCQIIINGEVKKTLKASDAFGELSLLYNAPRSASVKAIGDCAFWAIDRNSFRKIIEDLSLKDYEVNRKFIQDVKFFNSLTEEQRDSICNALITLVFKKGEHIVNQGDMANSFFIIKQGSVSVIQNDKEIRKMVAGESFGEQALYQNSSRGATVKAVDEEVKCLALSRDDLQRILGDKIQVIMYTNLQKWAMEKNPILAGLTKIQVEKLLLSNKNVPYVKGDIVYTGGSQYEKFVIVLEGQMVQASDFKVVASKGQIYGEEYLTAKNQNLTVPTNIIMDSDGLLAEIEFKAFFECIGGTLEQIMQKNLNSHEVKYMRKHDENQRVDYSHMKLEQMISIKKLGQGQFGNVHLVKNLGDGKFYALKCISKAQIVEQNLEKHLAQEKKVLETASFPLMMQFIRSFKDNNFIFFLVEYIRGMELFDVIREIGLLNTYDSQFYIGSLVLCMEYLHTNHIIYRDIKPENIMIDDKGYMRLIDMGTAKFLKGKGGRTYTIIGTPHYMAPEILTGKGYSYAVDLWSIGVCLYEFMCGGVPYAEDADDPYEIYEEIIRKQLTYPSFVKDRKAKKMMDQLLSKTPELRMGSSFASLKANSWFDHFDWDKLMDRELKAPYVPPKNKIISDKEIQSMVQKAKPITKELTVVDPSQVYKKEKAKDSNWDKDY